MFEATNRRLYTKEFKQDAVNLSKQPGYGVSAAAKSLGIAERQVLGVSASGFYRWLKRPPSRRSDLSQKMRNYGTAKKRFLSKYHNQAL
jgi:transposase-like protein